MLVLKSQQIVFTDVDIHADAPEVIRQKELAVSLKNNLNEKEIVKN